MTVSFNAITSGIGGGLTGLVIHSSTKGETGQDGGNKVVHMGVSIPPGYLIKRVRLAYELSDRRSYISQIRLAQVQIPPSAASVLLDDSRDLIDPGPACVDSAETKINPCEGPVLLSLRVHFGDVSDRIVVRGLGFLLTPA